LPDAENGEEKLEEEKIVGKMGKTVAAPAIPKPKVNALPSGSSSLSDLPDIQDPTSLASSTKSTREK
jgi:hypothetical protein